MARSDRTARPGTRLARCPMTRHCGGVDSITPRPATSPDSITPRPATSPDSITPRPATSPDSITPRPATSPDSITPRPATSLSSGDVLTGRYRLIDHLGAGGMSVVWRAHDQVLDREVAVKVLAGPAASAAYPPDGIWIEARAVARLSHPHIASVFDYGEVVEEQGRCVPFVVMELLRGVSLAKLTGPGAMQPATAMRLCAQIG